MTGHAADVATGRRFEFGRNWSNFLSVLDDERIRAAEDSVRRLLGGQALEGKTFIDVGSGSGLFSLAARRLGMNVLSFDYDPSSVACTREVRRRYAAEDPRWQVLEGSILDETFVKSLGRHDVVYSWGVLHHTGEMWKALDLAGQLVADDGHLVVAIYNDQGPWTRVWQRIKKTYNWLPRWLKTPFVVAIMVPREIKIALVPFLKLKPGAYFALWTGSASPSVRGMSRWYDMVDWVGGYPFEVARPEEIFEFFQQRGFELKFMKTCAGELGCNEFVLRRGRRSDA